jgi:hypothetical protein
MEEEWKNGRMDGWMDGWMDGIYTLCLFVQSVIIYSLVG